MACLLLMNGMKTSYIIKCALFLLVFFVQSVAAQECPTRTAEEEAMKQTEMLQRELTLTPEQRDTIYRIHLKYARLRRESNTRQEMLERMNAMMAELLSVMTKPQQQLFLGKQIDFEPRRQQNRVARIPSDNP